MFYYQQLVGRTLVLLDSTCGHWTGCILVQTLFPRRCFTATLDTTYACDVQIIPNHDFEGQKLNMQRSHLQWLAIFLAYQYQ